MANLTCHDTPLLKGFWQGDDIDLCEQLGIFTAERAVKEREGRIITRKAMINTLASINELPHGVSEADELSPEYSRDLMQRITFYLSRSCAQIANIQLEDCMMIDTSVNVPGTSVEYPNWRRRLTENLKTFFDDVRRRSTTMETGGCSTTLMSVVKPEFEWEALVSILLCGNKQGFFIRLCIHSHGVPWERGGFLFQGIIWADDSQKPV